MDKESRRNFNEFEQPFPQSRVNSRNYRVFHFQMYRFKPFAYLQKKKKNCQSIEGYSLPFFFESLIFESSNLPLQNLISTVHNLSRRKIPPSNLLSNFETAFGPRNCVWPRDITLYAT